MSMGTFWYNTKIKPEIYFQHHSQYSLPSTLTKVMIISELVLLRSASTSITGPFIMCNVVCPITAPKMCGTLVISK
jgi:hypothetical protein